MVALVRQGHKVEPGTLRGGCNTHACVKLPGSHGMGHGGMRGFGALVVGDVSRCKPILSQQFIQHHPGAGAQGTVGEAGTPLANVFQGVQCQRVAFGHHQPLGSLRKTDDLVLAGLQQRLVGALGEGLAAGVLQGVEARHHTAALIEGTNRIHAPGEANVQVQGALTQFTGLLQGVLTQGGQGVVVAGIQRDHMHRVIKRLREAALQFPAQGLDLRGEAGLCLTFSPHELGTKLGQAG